MRSARWNGLANSCFHPIREVTSDAGGNGGDAGGDSNRTAVRAYGANMVGDRDRGREAEGHAEQACRDDGTAKIRPQCRLAAQGHRA